MDVPVKNFEEGTPFENQGIRPSFPGLKPFSFQVRERLNYRKDFRKKTWQDYPEAGNYQTPNKGEKD